MLGFFQSKPLLDEATTDWLHEVFGWALKNLGADVFHAETALVLPTEAFFPGRANSAHAMAGLMFDKVQAHAGLAHWSCRLVEPERFDPSSRGWPHFEGAIRGTRGIARQPACAEEALAFTYNPGMVSNPEALIATFTHAFAAHLGALAADPPPGGEENWPHITELLGVFMGFGLMFANSAFNLRSRSCGSCSGAVADRVGYLSQEDLTYALALFCVLKRIPNAPVLAHLKRSLHPFFSKAVKEIRRDPDRMARLWAIESGAPLLTDITIKTGSSPAATFARKRPEFSSSREPPGTGSCRSDIKHPA